MIPRSVFIAIPVIAFTFLLYGSPLRVICRHEAEKKKKMPRSFSLFFPTFILLMDKAIDEYSYERNIRALLNYAI